MPGPYPREFREDVVAVARRRESGVTIKQIATDLSPFRSSRPFDLIVVSSYILNGEESFTCVSSGGG